MENYLLGLLAYGLIFVFAHFIGLRKKAKKSQLSADFVLSDLREDTNDEIERIETKSVA